MRIFTRYVLREVVSYALLGGVLFTFVLFMRDLGKILDLVVRDSASLADVLRIVAYTLPNTLTFTIPTAVLAGILLGLSRLSADSEITAMRACGIGALTFVRIVSILSFTALAFGLVNALYFVPRAAGNLLKLEDQLKSSQASFEVQPRVFYEDFKNYVLYVQEVRPIAGASSWRHVFLADLTQPTNPNVINAESAIVSSSGPQGVDLHMLNGGKHELSATNPNQYDITSFTSTATPRTTPTSRASTPPSRRSRSASSGSAPTVSAHPATPSPPTTFAQRASRSIPASPIPSPASSSCSSASPSASPPTAAARAPASSLPSS
jgi:lipopolysaccharide export LptBFGC system permease protein LptF